MTAFALFGTTQPTDLITAVSGITNGIAWTIESVFGRRAGFRLFIGGQWMATFNTSIAADEFRRYWFETNEPATAGTAPVESEALV